MYKNGGVDMRPKDEIVRIIQDTIRGCGYSVNKALTESGAGRNLVSDIRRGQIPSIERLTLLGDFLGVSVDRLVGRENKIPSPPAGNRRYINYSDEHIGVLEADETEKFTYDTDVLASVLTKRIEEQGLNVEEALVDSGAGKDLIENVKNGQFPNIDKLAVLADFLSIPIDYLLGRAVKYEKLQIPKYLAGVRVAFSREGMEDITQEEIDKIAVLVKGLRENGML